MSSKILEEMTKLKRSQKFVGKMTPKEINQFLTCARVGRIGISLKDGPYVVPVGYAYVNGKIFFHSCYSGLKMKGIRRNPNVCFEVDEALSDISMLKSVIIFGIAEIIDDKEEMIPYLQKLIDKYRVQVSFDEYISRPGLNREKELKIVRICVITPKKITGWKMARARIRIQTSSVAHSFLRFFTIFYCFFFSILSLSSVRQVKFLLAINQL